MNGGTELKHSVHINFQVYAGCLCLSPSYLVRFRNSVVHHFAQNVIAVFLSLLCSHFLQTVVFHLGLTSPFLVLSHSSESYSKKIIPASLLQNATSV